MNLNRANLKKLAQLSFSGNQISAEVERFVLTRLNKSELKTYLLYLKREILDKKVYVRTPEEPDKKYKERIEKLFKDKQVEILYEPEKALGAGIQIQYSDNLLELSAKNLINKTYNQIKESL